MFVDNSIQFSERQSVGPKVSVKSVGPMYHDACIHKHQMPTIFIIFNLRNP